MKFQDLSHLSVHAASQRASKDVAIIADLAGKRRNQYTQEERLLELLASFSKDHPYSKRFEQFLRNDLGKASKGEKKRARALALKLIHALDGKESPRRADVVQSLLADPVGYDEAEVGRMIRRLHGAKLIFGGRGPYGTIAIR